MALIKPEQLRSGFYDITGSLFGTSSYADFALTASYAITSSFVTPLYQDVSISGSLKLDPTQDPDPSGLDLDSTVLFQSSSNTTLGYDLYIRQNGNLVKWKWIEGTLETGLLYGGVVTYSGNNVFVSPGSGIIIEHNATTGSEVSPMVEYVTWSAITQSIVNIATQQVTYLYIDQNGALQQQSTRFTSQQYHNFIPLGAVGHFDYTQVSAFGGQVQTAYDQVSQIMNFVDAFGPLKISGYGLTGQAGSLQLSIGSGTSYIHGGFYENDPEFPSQIATPSQATANLARVYRSGSSVIFDTNGGALYTTVNPTQYDRDGDGTLANVGNGNWSIQRVFTDPKTGVLYVYYGQARYTTLLNALQYLPTDPFIEGDTFDFTTFVGYLVLRGNASDLTDTANNSVINGGLFRGSGQGSGGGIALSNLDDLTDVSIVSPTNGEALIYNAGIWQNGVPLNAQTASFAPNYTLTSSFNAFTSSYNTGSFTGSFIGDGSQLTGIVSSKWSGSNPITRDSSVEITGSLTVTEGITGSLQGTASFATTASVNTNGNPLIGGSITSGQVAFGTGSGVIGGDAGLTWDNVNKRLGVGTNAPAYQLSLAGSATIQGISGLNLLVGTRGVFFGLAGSTEVSTFLSTSPLLFSLNQGSTAVARFAATSGNFLINTATDSGAKLHVQAQGALSTDIAFRVRNSANTLDIIRAQGDGSVFVGLGAGNVNTGANNSFFGIDAGRNNTTGVSNTADGVQALRNNTTGNSNTANGVSALFSNTTGGNNTANGVDALFSNTTGGNNTANGLYALRSNTTGNANTANGHQAGRFIADGVTPLTITNNSVFLGVGTKALADNQTNQIVIGHNAIGLGSNTAVLGNDSITLTGLKGNVAIGATTAGARLDVRAQGALSTDIAFRVRNSANTLDLLSLNGQGKFTHNGRTASDGIAYELIGNNSAFGNFVRHRISFGSTQYFDTRVHLISGINRTDFVVSGGNFEGGSGVENTAFRILGNGTERRAQVVFRGNIVVGEFNTFGEHTNLNASTGTAIFQNAIVPPTVSITDCYHQYSADIVAGNAAPHFRTENGSVIKLYQQSAVTSSQGLADVLTNVGLLSGSSVIAPTFPYTGSAEITGSLTVTGSVAGAVQTLAIISSTASLDLSQGNFFELTLSSSTTTYLEPINIQPGQTINLKINQPATSGSLTYDNTLKFPGGIPYNVSSTGSVVDILSMVSFDNSTLYATAIKNLS
jgi:hypothetical protein